MRALFLPAGEAIEIEFFVGAVLGAVEALEEPAIEEGNIGKERDGLLL